MTNKIVYNALPREVRSVLVITEGWLVGGAITSINLGHEPKDYDIIVPNPENFRKLLTTVDVDKLTINSFGGVKFEVNGIFIDMWVESLDNFLLVTNGSKYVYNITRNLLYESK